MANGTTDCLSTIPVNCIAFKLKLFRKIPKPFNRDGKTGWGCVVKQYLLADLSSDMVQNLHLFLRELRWLYTQRDRRSREVRQTLSAQPR